MLMSSNHTAFRQSMALNITVFRQFMATIFSVIFFLVALILTFLTGEALYQGFVGNIGLVEAVIKSINMAIVVLAIFELGLVVNREYGCKEGEQNLIVVLRRTVPRFVSIVCIALVLEGLLLVIKYSQLGPASNLNYSAIIIISAAILLAALGIFMRLTDDSHNNHNKILFNDKKMQADGESIGNSHHSLNQ
ncbi:hypothetical protein BCL69_101014 [Nitrosomonas communis]|uniref:Uncharacterized protein n=2 Tax=Nitrosomonadaceae TaxID=206379 RepID=A0A5D3YDL6_9PROT|nr:hypothetical protein [Nitrosomonas sp. PLL12-2]TYP91243.1 hypothetical protein BCL69_101014 [Nitrosomonas communis]